METHQRSFLWLAKQPSVVKRATKIAIFVGIVLATINHGDAIMSGTLSGTGIIKILVTFCVPYCVSTYSSVLAIRERSQIVLTLQH
ncbi:nitrate/nitrite transporter NrtS [Planktotalea sp.]|uniref:nitrate/nitrite transporter NrtS n=1 Tax=Planktotalea sp. TaxID=2029877 RepID=UPI00344B98ED